jgi:AcrR family transcriptional regulator
MRRAPFSDNPQVGARGQRTQQRILDAALRVFGEEGYHQ